MIEYIKKEDALKEASHECYELRGTFARIEKAINMLPSANVIERKYGEWIESSELDIAWGKSPYTCSNCGRRQKWKSNFCPDCGTDMRVEQTESKGEK